MNLFVSELQPNRLDNLKTLRYVNLDGAFITVFGNLVGDDDFADHTEEGGRVAFLQNAHTLLGFSVE